MAISIPSALLLKDFSSAIRLFFHSAGLFMVLLVALYVSRYLSKPIIELADAANRLAEGDLAAKVELETTGEVQMLVELHGGNIWAESEGEGKGSAFSFCIPTL